MYIYICIYICIYIYICIKKKILDMQPRLFFAFWHREHVDQPRQVAKPYCRIVDNMRRDPVGIFTGGNHGNRWLKPCF